MNELPPLPGPDFQLVWTDRSVYKVTKPNIGNTDVYTADQMRAYARAALAAQPGSECERCGVEQSKHNDPLHWCDNQSFAPTEAKPAPAPGYCKHCKQYTIEEPLPAQQDAAEAGALSPEQEEWVMDLAQNHNLGRRVGQIGTLQGVSPDVFYTDASYRTQELFDFAAELLASSELNADQRRALVGNWFAEDWAVHQALGLLDDYDTERAAISAKKGQP